MNTSPNALFACTASALLWLAAPPLSAQSTAFSNHVSQAASHSTAASGQAIAASGEAGVAAVKATSGAAAVAFWSGGTAFASVGSAVAAVGESTAKTGTTLVRGADAMWDFASGDPARRPALNRQRSVPPLKPSLKQSVKRDPSPAEMLRTVKR